jgi:hypothetical protein
LDERLSTSDREDLYTFFVVTNNPYYTQNKWIIEDLLNKSLEAKHGNYSLFDIQSEILSNIIAADAAKQKYARWKDRYAKAIGALKKNKSTLARIKEAQSRFEFVQNSEIAARLFIGQLRSVGDGIAWWFLNYDRASLRLLAEHDYVPVPTLGTGLDKEIYECARLASKGHPFLLNSITNFLRIGDITIFDKSTNTFKLLEVKAGKLQTPRTIRQGKHLAIVQESLKRGSHSLSSGVTIANITSRKPLLTYTKILETAMLEAKQKLASSRVFGHYLSFGVFYLKEMGNLPEKDTKQIQGRIIDRCMSILQDKNDIPLPFMSNIFATVHFSRMLAPYTIFPIDPSLRFSLLTGEFLIISQLNVSGLARWLEKRGWKTKIIMPPSKFSRDDKPAFVPVLQVFRNNRPLGVEIGLDIISCAAMEFWMAEAFERMLLATPTKAIRDYAYSVNFPNIGKYAWD